MGEIGKKGVINKRLLDDLDKLDYYKKKPPKSLGREWVEVIFNPVIERHKISDVDKLSTVYEHIACQISTHLNKGKTLITGGGAFNTFLISLIQ